MRGSKALLSAVALLTSLVVATKPAAIAQAPTDSGPQPTCQYGYYGYPPYACAPRGFYGPDYFYNRIFVGVGPWANWGYTHGWGEHRFIRGGVEQAAAPAHSESIAPIHAASAPASHAAVGPHSPAGTHSAAPHSPAGASYRAGSGAYHPGGAAYGTSSTVPHTAGSLHSAPAHGASPNGGTAGSHPSTAGSHTAGSHPAPAPGSHPASGSSARRPESYGTPHY